MLSVQGKVLYTREKGFSFLFFFFQFSVSLWSIEEEGTFFGENRKGLPSKICKELLDFYYLKYNPTWLTKENIILIKIHQKHKSLFSLWMGIVVYYSWTITIISLCAKAYTVNSNAIKWKMETIHMTVRKS